MIFVMKIQLLTLITTLALFPGAAKADHSPPDKLDLDGKAQNVEICFVLDTTGSMGGLIAGAKRKIWSIANEAVFNKPEEIRFGLLGYRDRGDEYVTRKTELTKDLDAVHTVLNSYAAKGGGDRTESVNQALKEAVSDQDWSADDKVRKLIFLVGDQAPHMDYEQELQYPEICKLAKKKGILINTILCGGHPETAKVWKEIAQMANGRFAAIPQTGGVVEVKTPFDAKLQKLSVSLNKTVSSWGTQKERRAFNAKLDSINGASVEAQATRQKYASENFAKGRAVSGQGDLVNDWAEGSVKLADIKPDQLEGDLKGLSGKKLEAKLKEKMAERKKIQKKIAALTDKRNQFIKAEREKAGKERNKDSFDAQVSEMLKDQLTPSSK